MSLAILNGGNYAITQLYGVNASFYKPIGLAYHPGIDIVGTKGDWNIEAVEAGVVEYAGWKEGGFGNFVKIYCPQSNREWQYMHLHSVSCTKGQQIKAGQPVGVIGNTGNSFGRHLHLDVKYRGKNSNNGVYGCVDPMPILEELNRGHSVASSPIPKTASTPIEQKVEKKQVQQQPQIITNPDELTMSQYTDLLDKIQQLEGKIDSKIDAKLVNFATKEDINQINNAVTERFKLVKDSLQNTNVQAEKLIQENRTEIKASNEKVGEIYEDTQSNKDLLTKMSEADNKKSSIPLITGGGAGILASFTAFRQQLTGTKIIGNFSLFHLIIVIGIVALILGFITYDITQKNKKQ